MSPKIANLIALELGILIAILAWLALSSRPGVNPRPAREEQARPAGSFATVVPTIRSRPQRLPAADYLADRTGEQVEDEGPAPAVQEYDQEIAAEPRANSNLADAVVNESSPYYDGVGREPVVSPTDCLVSPANQIVEYVQPNEIIVFSNARSFGRRPRSTVHFGGARMMVAQRRPGVRAVHPGRGGLVAPRNSNTRPSRPTQGIQGSLNR